MYSLNSSLIKSYDYNSDSKVLKISFVDNAEVAYDFEGVPEPLFQEFRASNSKGRFFNSSIRGRFPATKAVV